MLFQLLIKSHFNTLRAVAHTDILILNSNNNNDMPASGLFYHSELIESAPA